MNGLKARSDWLEKILTGLLLAFYGGYILFVIQNNRGPIDYETFMNIGVRLWSGAPIYGPNSYYPLPYVMIFAAFSALPRPLSMALWLSLPVIAALIIARGKPYALLYAPTLAHFMGGQSAIFGLLGFWGYRRCNDLEKMSGGIWLALTLLKPQLGLLPCAYAIFQWVKYGLARRRVPPQALGFIGMALLIYLPGLFILPGWPWQWLHAARPLFYSAMAGILPRVLIAFLSPTSLLFWGLWIIGAAAVGLLCWRRRRRLDLDTLMLWGFTVSPVFHNYDLIQLLPILENPRVRWAALWLSIPAWGIMFFAYGNKEIWTYFTLFAPFLLWAWLNARPPADSRVELTHITQP